MSSSTKQRLRDRIAKGLWTGEVREGAQESQVGNLATSSGYTYQREFPVQKNDGLRMGTVPEHIEIPQKGRPRSYDPFTLRKLAQTETCQTAINTIIKEVTGIPWSVGPLDDEANPSDSLLTDIERNLDNINPNPETFADINEMFIRDALEVGNFAAITNLQMDGREAEVIPYDPNTFTVDWDSHRILQRFYQYPLQAGSRFGDPTEIPKEQTMWGTLNPMTTRAGFYGYSPVEVVQNVINVLGGLIESEIKELEEGMPAGIISLVGDEWDDDDYEHFETYWENEVKGEQHKLPYTRGEATFTPFNMSYKELQVLDRQRWYNKLVGAAFGVPVNESGLVVGDLNRAIDVSQRQRFKNKTVRSILTLLEDVWNIQYIHRWWSEEAAVRFDPGLDLMERKELSTIHSTYLREGVKTINDVREELGMDEVEWGDEPFDRKVYARAEAGAADTPLSETLLDGDPGSGGDPDGGQTTPSEQESQALEEGQQPDTGESGTNFKSAYPVDVEGTWVGKSQHVISAKALRNVDNPYQFSFQPGEIEALAEELKGLFEDYIEGVADQIRGNQQLLRPQGEEAQVEKGLADFMQLIEEEIGLDFAQDTADILATHKSKKVLEGEEQILSELRAAGVAVDELDLDVTRRRVVDRIQQRTLKVTKPISQRLEQQIREVLDEGWQQGHSITDIERNIEELTDKWQGTDAERLARDQLGKASKEGRMEYAKDTAGQVGGWEKTWITTGGRSGDGRTRDSHQLMHGKTVRRDEPFIVNYAPDGGPAQVQEDYPGESYWGIQCRCDFSLAPAGSSEQVSKNLGSKSQRMQEIEQEHSQSLEQLLLAMERNPSISRNQAAQELGVSKPTYYDWARQAGLIEE